MNTWLGCLLPECRYQAVTVSEGRGIITTTPGGCVCVEVSEGDQFVLPKDSSTVDYVITATGEQPITLTKSPQINH